MEQAIFLNGVYDDVLKEIMDSQEKNRGMVFYLQPSASHLIKLLDYCRPDKSNPIPLYISTTKNLDKVCYAAEIIGWENRQRLPDARLDSLNAHIKRYQPEEKAICLTENGKKPINLISIINLRKVTNQFSVTNLIKTNNKNETCLKIRTQAGGWSYVRQLPSWIGLEQTVLEENLTNELERGMVV